MRAGAFARLAVVAIALGGCADHAPTGLANDAVIEPRPMAAFGADHAAAIDDAVDRLLPALADEAAAAPLRAALSTLQAHMRADRLAALPGARTAALEALRRYESRVDASGHELADIAAIRLALESDSSSN